MILTAAAIGLLLSQSACGAVDPGSELAVRLKATAVTESSGDTLVIGVNGVSPNERIHHFSTLDAAIAYAHDLDARHIDYDAGLFQINRKYGFSADGLAPETAFDACQNARAAVHHLRANFATLSNLASRLYNCGGLNCGQQYAALVDAAAERVRVGIDARRSLNGAVETVIPPPCTPDPTGWHVKANCLLPDGADAPNPWLPEKRNTR